MAISLKSDEIVSISQAAKRLPKRSNGKAIHVASVYRWIGEGINGVRLESVRIGGRLFTSVEALQRFTERLTRKGEEDRVQEIDPDDEARERVLAETEQRVAERTGQASTP